MKNFINTEELLYKNYEITIITDKNYDFTAILIDGENRNDIYKAILQRWCPDEVVLYPDSYRGWNTKLYEPLASLIYSLI